MNNKALGRVLDQWFYCAVLALVGTISQAATLDQFIVFGTGDVTLAQACQVVGGSVGSNDTATFDRDNQVDGNVYADYIVANRDTAFGSDVHFNTFDKSQGVPVLGSEITPLAPPILTLLAIASLGFEQSSGVATSTHKATRTTNTTIQIRTPSSAVPVGTWIDQQSLQLLPSSVERPRISPCSAASV